MTTELTIEEILSIYHMRKMPKGTTENQWRHYHDEMIVHNLRYDARKPNAKDYANDEIFESKFSAWQMDEAMSRPNPPGYTYSNNH